MIGVILLIKQIVLSSRATGCHPELVEGSHRFFGYAQNDNTVLRDLDKAQVINNALHTDGLNMRSGVLSVFCYAKVLTLLRQIMYAFMYMRVRAD